MMGMTSSVGYKRQLMGLLGQLWWGSNPDYLLLQPIVSTRNIYLVIVLIKYVISALLIPLLGLWFALEIRWILLNNTSSDDNNAGKQALSMGYPIILLYIIVCVWLGTPLWVKWIAVLVLLLRLLICPSIIWLAVWAHCRAWWGQYIRGRADITRSVDISHINWAHNSRHPFDQITLIIIISCTPSFTHS